jgi:hypothetical protein
LKGGGTGFIGITDKRVIIQDSAFLRKEKAIVSVPYDRIHAIAASEDTGMLGGRGFFAGSKLILSSSAGAYELEFRGADKAHAAHDMILTRIL